MLLSRLIKQAKMSGVGGKYEALADAASDSKRKEGIERCRKVAQAICENNSRDELISKIAISLYRLELANLALEGALGGDFQSETFLTDTMLQEFYQIKIREILRAKTGGKIRAEKFKALESATIKLYQAGKWASAPLAAQEIAPQIVALSSGGNGDLLLSTTRPLQWIRTYLKNKILS